MREENINAADLVRKVRALASYGLSRKRKLMRFPKLFKQSRKHPAGVPVVFEWRFLASKDDWREFRLHAFPFKNFVSENRFQVKIVLNNDHQLFSRGRFIEIVRFRIK